MHTLFLNIWAKQCNLQVKIISEIVFENMHNFQYQSVHRVSFFNHQILIIFELLYFQNELNEHS